jgi:hypothetical protein
MKSLTLSIKPLFFLRVLILSACGGGGGGVGSATDNLAPTVTAANFQVEQDTGLAVTILATGHERGMIALSQTGLFSNDEIQSSAANAHSV